MVRVSRAYLVLLLVVGCSGDQIVSSPPEEEVLLWRGNRMYVASASQIDRAATRAVTLPDVHDIADVDVAGKTVALSVVPSNLQGCDLLLGTAASGFREVVAIPAAVPALALSIDGRRMGYSCFAGNAEAYDVYAFDTAEQQPSRLLGSQIASPTGSLSFRPGRNALTFEDTHGRISSIDLQTLRLSPVAVGKRPRWSHDGSRLAFRDDEAVYVYDAAQNKSIVAYRRSATDGNFDGSLFWSRTDRFVGFNLNVGVDAPNRRCLIVDTLTARVALAVTTPYLCGPFVSSERE